MDSPQLLHLAFLLLALAAPHPNIAMSAVGPAEGREDNSKEISVYRCKYWNNCLCESWPNTFEQFKIIHYTDTKIFSDGIIELVTNKTHITVCFEEPNTCPETMYVVSWKIPGESGQSCGILSSGENGRGGMSTEKKTVCCEAETDTKKNNTELKCFYTQMSRPTLNTLQTFIPGNPDVPTGKTDSVLMAICITVLCFGIFTALLTVYISMKQCDKICPKASRQDRQAHEGENLPLQEDQVEQREPLCQQHPPPLSGCTATD